MTDDAIKSKGLPDIDAIRRTLAVLAPPGQVVELRCLDVSTPRHKFSHTVSGYFVGSALHVMLSLENPL